MQIYQLLYALKKHVQCLFVSSPLKVTLSHSCWESTVFTTFTLLAILQQPSKLQQLEWKA